MRSDEIEKYLGNVSPGLEVTKWLRNTYFPNVVRLLNAEENRKRLAIYPGELVPENESNLTDVRNRVSLILENELARLSNDLLAQCDVSNLYWTYVVANRFPDLEVRKKDGTRTLRVEVKCLQSIAEEKSANFDTLIKDLVPSTDYVVVFVWEWDKSPGTLIVWERAPLILKCYVFHAYSLAQLRDRYWLGNPPSKVGNGFQGFDLRYGVNSVQGEYSEEEGNYGKLLRIGLNEFRPSHTNGAMVDTEAEYFRLKSEVVFDGFLSIAKNAFLKFCGSSDYEAIFSEQEVVGAKSGRMGFLLKSRLDKLDVNEFLSTLDLDFAVVMTERYISTVYSLSEGKVRKRFVIKKPKLLSEAHINPA